MIITYLITNFKFGRLKFTNTICKWLHYENKRIIKVKEKKNINLLVKIFSVSKKKVFDQILVENTIH